MLRFLSDGLIRESKPKHTLQQQNREEQRETATEKKRYVRISMCKTAQTQTNITFPFPSSRLKHKASECRGSQRLTVT